MNMIHQENQSKSGQITRKPNRIAAFFLHFLLPLVALACGIAITMYLLKTAPEAKPRKRPPSSTLVTVKSVTVSKQPTVIQAMGEIVAAKEIELKSRVGGDIISVAGNFIPGGYFRSGQTMVKIDPTDYKLVIQQRESDVAKAASDIAIEMGNQRIAEKELALLGRQVSNEERNLILRKPQLAKLTATKTLADAQLAKARLDLERTAIQAPFNSVIEDRSIDKGSKVNESTVLAKLVGTDSFWLNLSVPVEQLKWIEIPTENSSKGSHVTIYPTSEINPERVRTGQVIRLNAALEEQGRMAQLLVQIDDPLCLMKENKGKPQLLLGSYVHANITGKVIEDSIKIDRAHIHDSDKIWLMDQEGQLAIRTVKTAFKNRESVIITDGLSPEDRIVTSSLASPVEGIPLRLAGKPGSQKPTPGSGKGQGEGRGKGGMNSAQ